ncbi:putative decarboxylase [Neisseria meningitidis FAM18]|uniref:Flavin prenyltransferase UbiX n=1 Tax=Neisseria meningitidis serogroup C / serotype 2a (strain ATCC 700532 / DSM 15464 / FAM18) TaxID=272831 RepID=A1KW21_NEIMF|nr:putative decarboxylase [Neisseria meningitidis FAM18]
MGVADNLYPYLSDFCFFTIIAGLPLQAVLWERRMMVRRLIIGISGASGFQYGVKALELLRAQDIETHLVVSKGAEMARASETAYARDEVYALADFVHPIGNIGACIASGTFKTDGMLVAPCSMRTLASVAHGFGDNLLTRAADVVLKERRRLVLMVRETPLNLAHLDNMKRVTEMGGVVFPPVPAMYRKPQTADDIVAHSVAHALSLFGIDTPDSAEWQGMAD